MRINNVRHILYLLSSALVVLGLGACANANIAHKKGDNAYAIGE